MLLRAGSDYATTRWVDSVDLCDFGPRDVLRTLANRWVRFKLYQLEPHPPLPTVRSSTAPMLPIRLLAGVQCRQVALHGESRLLPWYLLRMGLGFGPAAPSIASAAARIARPTWSALVMQRGASGQTPFAAAMLRLQRRRRPGRRPGRRIAARTPSAVNAPAR